METLSRDQIKDQGQQNLAYSTHIRPLLTAEQLAESAASHDRTEQMKKAPEPFAKEEEAPARRTEELQSTGIQNQRFLAITPVDQSHPIFPAPTASNQESSTRDASPRHYDNIQPMTSTLSTNADLHEQLQKEIRKEFELLYDSRLVKRTADLEAFWRGKREERTKEVENYWKQKLTEVVSQRRDGESTRELHEQIEKLKTRLEKGPGLIKAAEERGRRQGELDGFNKLSLNPELKPSQDRLNFEFLMKEKNKEIAEVKAARDNWFRVARKFSGETIAKLREQKQQILRLQTLVQDPPPQKPSALDNAEVLITAGQKLQRSYDKQTQELVRLQEKCNQQAADLANLKARLHHRSEESSNRDQKLGDLSKELHKKTKEVSILRRESDQKSVKLSESTEQLEKKSREISILQEGRQEDLTELEKNRQQVKPQLEEIASLQTQQDNSKLQSPQPPPQTPPTDAHPAPPATGPSPPFRRLNFPAPRSLFIAFLIFFLAFFTPFLHSLATSGLEHEPVDLISRDDRMHWESWELAARDWDEGAPTYEESWRRTQEVGQMGDWGP